MNTIDEVHSSIFNEVESIQTPSYIFQFEKNQEIMDKGKNDIKYSEKLNLFIEKKQRVKHCRITFNNFAIIKYSSKNELIAKSGVLLRNPRIFKEEVEEEGSKIQLMLMLVGFKGKIIFYFDSDPERDTMYNALKNLTIQSMISAVYTPGNLIGKGKIAKVYKGTKNDNKEEYAIKVFNKKLISGNDRNLNSIKNEIDILRHVNHENIIKLYEVFEGKDSLYFVMELLNGGELFDFIASKKVYNEDIARELMKQILEAISYCHSLRIIHRDIKPENLLLEGKKEELKLKIADFGLGFFLEEGRKEYTLKCGSPGYMAPEILTDSGYDFKIDVFSCGVILHILLTGVSPFKGDNPNDVLNKNTKCEIDMNKDIWKDISNEGKDLCRLMLKKNSEERISSEESLMHKWFTKKTPSSTSLANAQSFILLNMEDNIQSKKKGLDPILKEEIMTSTPMMNSKKHLKIEISPNEPLFTPFSPLPQKREIKKQLTQFKISLKGIENEHNINQVSNPLLLGKIKDSQVGKSENLFKKNDNTEIKYDLKHQGSLPMEVINQKMFKEAKSLEVINIVSNSMKEIEIESKVNANVNENIEDNKENKSKLSAIPEESSDLNNKNIESDQNVVEMTNGNMGMTNVIHIHNNIVIKETNKSQPDLMLENKMKQPNEEINNRPANSKKTGNQLTPNEKNKNFNLIDPTKTKNFLNFLKDERDTFSKDFISQFNNNVKSTKQKINNKEEKSQKIEKQSKCNIKKSDSIVSSSGDMDIPEELEPCRINQNKILVGHESHEYIKSYIKVPLFPQIAKNHLKEELKQFPLVTIFEANEIDKEDGGKTVRVIKNIAHFRKANPDWCKTPLTTRKYLKK